MVDYLQDQNAKSDQHSVFSSPYLHVYFTVAKIRAEKKETINLNIKIPNRVSPQFICTKRQSLLSFDAFEEVHAETDFVLVKL